MTHVVDAGKNVFETTVLNRFHHFGANMPISLAKSKTWRFPKKRGTPKSSEMIQLLEKSNGWSMVNPHTIKCINHQSRKPLIKKNRIFHEPSSCWGSPGIPSHLLPTISGGACSSSASFQPLLKTAASSATFRDTRSNCSPERQRTWREAEIIHGIHGYSQLVIWEVITQKSLRTFPIKMFKGYQGMISQDDFSCSSTEG